ncbi:MAG: DNRLRE domain-containing protein [Verrucomicrobiota bacterium]
MKPHPPTALLLLVLLPLTLCAQPSANRPSKARICVTEWGSYYASTPEDFQKRFACYKELGVDTIRVETGWLNHPNMVSELKKSNFRLKMILYVLGIQKEYSNAHPTERMMDEHGVADWHLGPWNPAFEETTLRTARAEMEMLKTSGLAGRVKEVVADLGPAGEGIYPANWTVNDRKGEEAYWCYSPAAQVSFRSAMKAKYTNIGSANTAWALSGDRSFASWDTVSIPQPRTAWARGPFWNDMLIWYRDSKRKIMLQRIDQTQSLAKEYLGCDVKCIVYLPGDAYSQADWDVAVKEASGPAAIRLMMDNDWLMATAIAKGCTLQYTGVENADAVRDMVRKLKRAGSNAHADMWGENAGQEESGRNPCRLSEVITCFGLRGIDYTWSNWLFEKNGVTPSPTYARFAHAAKMINSFHATGRRLPALPPAEAVFQTTADVWRLNCVESTRIMSRFPDTLKSGDPEIAVVEGGQIQRILLKFPIEALPKGAKIRSAKLLMHRYLSHADDVGPLPLGIYRMTSSWTAINANWLEALPGIPWEHPGADAVDAAGTQFARGAKQSPWAVTAAPAFKAKGDAVEWDVTNLLRKFASGPDYGLMIAINRPGTGNKSFAGCAHPDPKMRPTLEVKLYLEKRQR